MKNFFKIFFIIIGTLIGAGFASGKEIYLFFVQYGMYGFFSLLISNCIIGIIIYKTFIIVKNNFGNNFFKKNFINLINIFLLFSFYIMVSGFNSFFYQELNIPKIIPCIIICILCFYIFKKNISRLLNINFILIPVLIFVIFLFAILDFPKINIINIFSSLINNNLIYCFIKSILYASYNCIILIPILISLNNYLKNKKQIFNLAFYCFLFLCILSIIIFIFVSLNKYANIVEIPIIYSINKFSNIQKLIYGIVIAIAIFTSAISSGFAFIDNLKIKNKYLIFTICIIPIFLINISFSFLVNLIFPLFGYIGLIQIVFILLKNFKKTDITN